MKPALRDDVRKVLERQGTSDPAFDAVSGVLMGGLDAHAAVVYTLDSRTGMLKLRSHPGVSSETTEQLRFLCVGKGLPGRAALDREPVQGTLSEHPPTEPENTASPESCLCVPMISENRLRGVLGIARDVERTYAPDEVATLTGIGRLIASFLK